MENLISEAAGFPHLNAVSSKKSYISVTAKLARKSAYMKTVKSSIISSLYKLKYFDLLRRLQKNRVIILMYHRFSEKPEPFKVQKDVFEKQTIFLKKKYNFISLSHYADVLCGKRKDLPPNSIILTIDDGYWDNYVHAYPILKKYNIPATIFITTEFVSKRAWLWSNKLEFILKNSKYGKFEFPLGQKNLLFDVSNFEDWHCTQLAIFNYCRTIPDTQKDEVLDHLARQLQVSVPDQTQGGFQPLTWEQIREMRGNGVEFGSHTCSHPILSKESSKELKRQILDSKFEIESEIGKKVNSFCYPNGQTDDISEVVVKCVREAGYSSAVTTIKGFNKCRDQDPFHLRRLSILHDDPSRIARALTRLI